MATEEQFLNYNPNVSETKPFLHLDGFFYINAFCIFTENKILKPLQIYDLLDFGDECSFDLRKVRFWHATLKGFTLKIIVLEIQSGEIIHRTYRMNDVSLPCDWLIIEQDYFNDNESSDEKVITDYCKRKY